jgi:hypothetical protein
MQIREMTLLKDLWDPKHGDRACSRARAGSSRERNRSGDGGGGSAMFPRDRVMHSLKKYNISFSESESTEDLRAKLGDYYAQRTLTRKRILPEDCANAIVWLAGDESAKTTGHIIPVDGGLQDAFLR